MTLAQGNRHANGGPVKPNHPTTVRQPVQPIQLNFHLEMAFQNDLRDFINLSQPCFHLFIQIDRSYSSDNYGSTNSNITMLNVTLQLLEKYIRSVLTAPRVAVLAEVHGHLRRPLNSRSRVAARRILQMDILFVVWKRFQVLKYLTFPPRRDLVRRQL